MANEYLKRTPTFSGNTRVFTWAGWVKLNDQNTTFLLTASPAKDNNTLLFVNSNGIITFFDRQGNDGSTEQIKWDPQFRDMSSWNHIVINADTNILSSTDRVSCYVNGIEIQRDEGSSLLNNSVNIGTPAISQEFWRLNRAGYIHYIGAHLDTSLSTSNENQFTDVFYVDGQKIGPEAFGFYKDGKGYISGGTTNSTDYRYGQWVPRTPREVKNIINENSGGFGINGFYLPFNDSSNVGADFHCTPNSIIKLKGEDLPQPRNGAPETTDVYVSQLRTDPYAANLDLAVPGISTSTSANLVTNGSFDSNVDGWTATDCTTAWESGQMKVTRSGGGGLTVNQAFTTVVGQRYTISGTINSSTSRGDLRVYNGSGTGGSMIVSFNGTNGSVTHLTGSFTATSTTSTVVIAIDNNNGIVYLDNVVVKQEDAPRDYSADIKGSGTNKTLTVSGASGVGYELGGYYGSALSFPYATGQRITTDSNDFAMGTGDFTIEVWINPDQVVNYKTIFSTRPNNGSFTDSFNMWISASGATGVYSNAFLTQTANGAIVPNQWTHVVAERYNNQLTTYVNGVAAATATNTQNFTRTLASLGELPSQDTEQFDGVMQDLRVYKGVAKYKGGFDVPKPYTPVNFEGGSWRTVSDTPQNNFATINRKSAAQDANASDGALTYTSGSANTRGIVTGTFGITTGKWYWEVRIGTVQAMPGIMGNGSRSTDNLPYPGGGGGGYHYSYFTDGDLYWTEGSGVNHPKYGDTFTVGDIIGVAVDGDNGTLTFYKNGVSQGIARSNLNSFDVNAWMPCVGDGSGTSGALAQINFGQNPTFSGIRTAGTYTDANGRGLFKYQPPDNHLALCEDNLPEPAIADPGEHFRTVLYDGNGSRKSVTGTGFKPDLVWIKARIGSGFNHILNDSVRGTFKTLFTNNTLAEYTDRGVGSFDEDGFTITNNSADLNVSTSKFVAWCWKAGGEAVENTDGTIHSKVSANQTAGFSIATWTGNGTGSQTIGHGLGKAPDFYIWKSRDNSRDWHIAHKGLTAYNYTLYFNTSMEVNNDKIYQAPNSTVIYPAASNVINGSNERYVGYFWTEIEGYSKFGSYEGNGLADGEFVYCGFKPHFVMLKIISPSGQERDWHIYDTARDPINQAGKNLRPSSIVGETNEPGIDLLSNGFKLTNSYTFSNYDQGKYIFAAFAESPFKTANAK